MNFYQTHPQHAHAPHYERSPPPSPDPNPLELARERAQSHTPTDDVAEGVQRQMLMAARHETWNGSGAHGIPPPVSTTKGPATSAKTNGALSLKTPQRKQQADSDSAGKAKRNRNSGKQANNRKRGNKSTSAENQRETSLEPAVGSPPNKDPPVYHLEYLMDKRIFKGKLQYLVKWHNFPEKDASWEPFEHVAECQEHIEEFETRKAAELEARKTASKKPKKPAGHATDETMEEPKVAVAEQQKSGVEQMEIEAGPSSQPSKKKEIAKAVDKIREKSLQKLGSVGDLVPNKKLPKEIEPEVVVDAVIPVKVSEPGNRRIVAAPVQPVFEDSAMEVEQSELVKLKPFAKKVVGIFLKDQDRFAQVHFENATGERFLRHFPMGEVKEVIPEKMLEFFMELTYSQHLVR